MGRMIMFSEASLRYFLYNLGFKLIKEYTDSLPDEEDQHVLDSIICWELGMLYRAIEKDGMYYDSPPSQEEGKKPNDTENI